MNRPLLGACTFSLVLVTGSARAEDSFALAVGQVIMLGPSVTHVSGTRPPQAGGDYTQNIYGLDGRLALALMEDRRGLSAQVGLEIGGRVFAAGEEGPKFGGDRGAVGAGFGLGLSIRPYSWTWPTPGAIVFHAGGDVASGGAFWWSTGARLAGLMGTRLTLGIGERGHAELDYTWVPAILANAPMGMSVERQEHRGMLTLGWGKVGIGGRVTYSRELTEQAALPDARTSALAITGLIELRIP
jgi:hypothetical protein